MSPNRDDLVTLIIIRWKQLHDTIISSLVWYWNQKHITLFLFCIKSFIKHTSNALYHVLPRYKSHCPLPLIPHVSSVNLCWTHIVVHSLKLRGWWIFPFQRRIYQEVVAIHHNQLCTVSSHKGSSIVYWPRRPVKVWRLLKQPAVKGNIVLLPWMYSLVNCGIKQEYSIFCWLSWTAIIMWLIICSS